MNRSHLSAEERRWRAKLAQLVSNAGLLRGSLTLRRRVCGRPNCRCTDGQTHDAWYLTTTKNGRRTQLYVPHQEEEATKQWVENFQRVRELLEKISELHWKRLKER